MRHSLLRKLRLRKSSIRNESHTPRRQHTYSLNLTPLGKMPRNNLLNIIRNMDPTHIQRAILAHKRPNTAHIIAVIAELVAAETVDIRTEEIMDGGQTVQILAFRTEVADTAREKQTEVGAGNFVGARVAAVFKDIAS